MLKNYFRVVGRGIKKQLIYTIVNLFGLAIGVACCVFIAIYIWDELGFDAYHQNGEQIYRVSSTIDYEGDKSEMAGTPFPLKEAILTDFPAYVKNAGRFFDMQKESVSLANRDRDVYYREKNFFFTDPSVLEIFDIVLLRGDSETALDEPSSVVITPEVGRRYFGDEDPMGQQILYDGRFDLTVTGIMEEWPRQSHFSAELLTSFETIRSLWGNYDALTERWQWNPIWTYIQLEEGTDPQNLLSQLDDFSDKYYSPFFGENEKVILDLQPLTDIYLYSNLNGEIKPTSSYLYILIFSVIGLMILLIACVNYINLSTAKSMQRSKEVGLRKTMGAVKSQLISQFLFESLIFAVIAVGISVVLVMNGLPYFNMLTGKEISIAAYGVFTITSITALIIVLITFLTGFYPSTFLSGFNPVEGVRGTFTKGKKGEKIRRGLVLFQFTVTAILLIGTSLAYFQYQHMQSMNMGYDQEQVVVVPSAISSVIWNYEKMKERAENHPSVYSVTGSKTVMGSDTYFTYQTSPEGFGEDDAYSIAKLFVMHDFLETMGIKLLAGRTFSKDFSTDPEEAMLINKMMVDSLGWGTPEEALNKTFRIDGREGTVVGVTENFHYAHLRHDLEPVIIELPDSQNQRVANIDYLKFRIDGSNSSEALEHIEEVWSDIDRIQPFEYYFLDSKIEEMYTTERQFSVLMGLFTILAFIIGCLGLLGLASYSVSERTKEIGIRKALGASTSEIFYMFSKNYIVLIVIAHIIALPIVYFAASWGLSFFPYPINLNFYLISTFVASITISIIVSLLTISSHTLKASRINPVISLQQE